VVVTTNLLHSNKATVDTISTTNTERPQHNPLMGVMTSMEVVPILLHRANTLPQHTLLISHHLQLRMVAILHRKVAMASNK